MKMLASLLFVAFLFYVLRSLFTGGGSSLQADSHAISDDDDLQPESEEDFLARERAFDHDDD